MVRTSPSRKKAVFDDLAARIEKVWYDAVGGPPTDPDDSDSASADKASKKMHFITFYPMIAARENGVTIPDVRPEHTTPTPDAVLSSRMLPTD
jgi:hypothetical protein